MAIESLLALVGVTIGIICWMVWSNSKEQSQGQPGDMNDDEIADA